jgi:TolA-binding protein
MKIHPDALDPYVRAFRDATSGSADMRATRGPVLAAAGQRAHRRPRPVARCRSRSRASSSAPRLRPASCRWRAAGVPVRPVIIEAERTSTRPEHRAAGAAIVIPAASSAPADAPDLDAAERAAYARAHVVHFAGTSWQRALAAWDDYLRSYPRGPFVPEARFNRALCLIRLQRFETAREALRPFAAGAVGAWLSHHGGANLAGLDGPRAVIATACTWRSPCATLPIVGDGLRRV